MSFGSIVNLIQRWQPRLCHAPHGCQETLDIPDERIKAVKLRAVSQAIPLKALVAQMLKKGMYGAMQSEDSQRVSRSD
jgi:hypothetical protein